MTDAKNEHRDGTATDASNAKERAAEFDSWENNDHYNEINRKFANICHSLFKDSDGGVRTSLSVLDFGSGPGFFLKPLLEGEGARMFDSVVAADITKHVVEYMENKMAQYGLKEKVTGLLLEKHDGSDLKSYEAAFDLVTCLLVLAYVKEADVQGIIQNFADATKKDGFVVVAEYDNMAAEEGGEAFLSFKRDEMETLLRDAGLTIVPVENSDFEIFFSSDYSLKGFVVVGKKE